MNIIKVTVKYLPDSTERRCFTPVMSETYTFVAVMF